MKHSLKELGSKLVADSMLNAEFSAQRGLINELFPSIYVASKRMSSRGISRWLEANGTKLSPATIAKALRNQTPYWQEVMDEIEPAALTFENAHNVKAEEFLKNHDLFEQLKNQPPILHTKTHDAVGDALDDYDSARAKLEEDWFSMNELAIEACLASATFGGKEIAGDNEKAKGE